MAHIATYTTSQPLRDYVRADLSDALTQALHHIANAQAALLDNPGACPHARIATILTLESTAARVTRAIAAAVESAEGIRDSE